MSRQVKLDLPPLPDALKNFGSKLLDVPRMGYRASQRVEILRRQRENTRRRWFPTNHSVWTVLTDEKVVQKAYRAPPSIYRELTMLLVGCRNRDVVMALANWLMRMNAAPKRINQPFLILRRSLMHRDDLHVGIGSDQRKLSEYEIKGAIKTLLKIGFIQVVPPADTSSRYQQPKQGNAVIWRKPILYTFAGRCAEILQWIARGKKKEPKQERQVAQSKRSMPLFARPTSRTPIQPKRSLADFKAEVETGQTPLDAVLSRFIKARENRLSKDGGSQ